MKLTLTSEAQEALKEIIDRIQSISPYSERSATAATAKIILDFRANADRAAFERVAGELVSPKRKRKELLRRLAALSEKDGEVALRVLEKSVRKLDRSNTETAENEAEN